MAQPAFEYGTYRSDPDKGKRLRAMLTHVARARRRRGPRYPSDDVISSLPSEGISEDSIPGGHSAN
ncbi:hypothetical protein [Methylobacterium sp.]|jgi:hypothetical protein|uniref:hypothetical protein n=1 Tax=Methylobacterium sp. TaxID=409 RepID=UPI000F8FE2AE|nr:hypothetical protein [Methylobacterium sp.]RUP18929.1 MAG: hypothetical protein EKK44_21835 [Methylobacterium sp.]